MIRKATPDDFQQILKINSAFVPKVSAIDEQWLTKYLDEAAVLDVFDLEGQVLGFVVAMLPECDYPSVNFKWFKERYSEFLYVDRIAVAETAHGRGIGKKFYEDLALKWKGRVPCITCEVNINPPNPQSYAFHQKAGFVEVGQQDTKGGTIRVAMLRKEI